MDRERRKVEAALAHDLNNYLQVIMGSLELLARRHELLPELVQNALAATRHAASLADRLAAVSALQPYEARTIDLNAAVAELAPMLRQTVGDAVRVQITPEREEVRARIDPRALRMALAELAANARQAMPAGGSLTVRTGAAREGTALLEVADTGAGLARETFERALEPLPDQREGSRAGFGLSIVDWCMRRAGGRVELAAAPGAGTRIVLHLPAA